MRQLETDLAAAMRGPSRCVVLPPGGPPLTDKQLQWMQRHDPAGRMRAQVQRHLFAASTAQSVVAAAEAAYRPRAAVAGWRTR
jgi:hypothetical protein